MKYYPFKLNKSYGIIDEKGNVIEAAGNYRMVGYFYGDYTTISDVASNEEKIWHKKSTTKVPQEVYYLFDISDGLAKAATEDHVCGYVNLHGEWQIPCKYFECSQFVNGYAVVSNEKNGKFGIISKNDEVVIDFDFDHINSWSKYGTTARLADKWFYLSPSFDVVEFGEVDFLYSPTIEGVFRYKKLVKRKVAAGFTYIDGSPAFTDRVFSGTCVWGAGFGGV
jgi:WG containing repeat